MTTKTIIVNQKEYTYQLNYKMIKHMYMRLNHNQVVVNVPYLTTKRQIKSFVSEHIEKMVQHLNQPQHLFFSLQDHYCYVLGKKYTLKYEPSPQFNYQMSETSIHLYGKHYDESLIYQLLTKLVKLKVIPMFNEILVKHPEFNHPHLSFQRMKTKWGVCFPNRQKIKLNTYLIHFKEELITYVIYHELVHLFEANHSSKYYQKLSFYQPNYKELKKQLNQKGDWDEQK